MSGVVCGAAISFRNIFAGLFNFVKCAAPKTPLGAATNIVSLKNKNILHMPDFSSFNNHQPNLYKKLEIHHVR